MITGSISLKTVAKTNATDNKFRGDEKHIHTIIRKTEREEDVSET
jgi:hypothetical protein